MKSDKIPFIVIIIVLSIFYVFYFINKAVTTLSTSPTEGILLVLSIGGILFGIISLSLIDNSLQSIAIKSYVIKKSSAKKIVDAMFSWNKLISNPDFIPYTSLFYFSINSDGVYTLKRSTIDEKGKSDYTESFKIKLEKNPSLIIKEVNSKYNKLSKYSVLLKQSKFISVTFTILDEINLEMFLNWIKDLLNKYKIDFQIKNEVSQFHTIADDSVEKRLSKLKELLDNGLITNQEYEIKRQQIIDKF